MRIRPIHSQVAAAAAKSLQSCMTLCDPTDGSPRGSPVPGILQARTLEWVAISFSSAWKWKVKVKVKSLSQTLSDPMDCSLPGPPSMGFSRQEYWSGMPLPSPIPKSSGSQILVSISLPESLILYSPRPHSQKTSFWRSRERSGNLPKANFNKRARRFWCNLKNSEQVPRRQPAEGQ